jgi:hypothetical protein
MGNSAKGLAVADETLFLWERAARKRFDSLLFLGPRYFKRRERMSGAYPTGWRI